jgi:uncharacterized repeat protein (TIGR02543 family)
MKTRNSKVLLSVFLLILLFITGCKNIATASSVKPKNSDGDIAYIKLDLQAAAARDIYPAINITNFTTFVLSGKWAGQEFDRNLASGDTWAEISGSAIPIQTGTWDFTLNALSADGRAFSANLDDVEISSSTTTLTFTLAAESNQGNFSIAVSVDKTYVSSNVDINLQFSLYKDGVQKFSPGPQSYNGTAVTFSPANEYYYDSGDYDMEIKVIAENMLDSSGNSIVLNTYKDKLHVIAGFNSTKSITIIANPVYDISYEYNDGTISEGSAGPALFSRKSSTANLPTLTKQGYTFLGWFDANTGGTQYTEVTVSKVTYYARFIPNSDTPYTVNHWMQKVGAGTAHNETNYELVTGVSTEDKTGTTEQAVSITAKDTTDPTSEYYGFAPPSSSELTAASATTIAADGSTVVDLYYNRKIYALSYDDGLGGTIEVPDACDVQFGSTYTVLFSPVGTRANYFFAGWSDGINTYKAGDVETLTVGADDVILTAIWLPLFAIVNGTNYYTLSDAQSAIRTATGNVTVVLTSAVSRSDIRIDDFNPNNIVDSNTISDALRNTTASSVSLSVRSGDTIELSGDCSYLFFRATKLKSIDLTGFDTTNATKIYGMFCRCSSLTSLDLSSLHTSNVINMMALFEGCTMLESITFGSNFDTSNVTSIHSMFDSCSHLRSLDLSGFDTSSATSFTGMFNGCSSLTQLDISSFTATVTGTNSDPNAPSMFYGCTNLETIIVSSELATYLSGLNASDASDMFKNCTKLVGANGTTFDSSKTDNAYARLDVDGTPGYFTPASDYAVVNGAVYTTRSATENAISSATGSIRIILGKSVTMDDIGNRDSGSILTKIYQNSSAQVTLIVKKDASISLPTDCSNMFADIDSLVALDLRGFTSSGVQNMEEMFDGCNNLQTINLTSFDTSDTESFESMFANCTNLTTIKVSTMFIIPNGSSTFLMFDGCTSIEGGKGTIYDDQGNHDDAYYARIDDPENGAPGYFTEGL